LYLTRNRYIADRIMIYRTSHAITYFDRYVIKARTES